MVDLASVAQQIRIDLLSVEVSRILTAEGISHALLKGPTTSWWLYDPPRAYRDVDILVPLKEIRHVVSALAADGIAHASAGRLGEEANHSLLMIAPSGLELDVHVTLPGLPMPSDERSERLWQVIAPHLEPFHIDGSDIPALDVPGRCLVLALHAVSGGSDNAQVREDLRRATARATETQWRDAVSLAKDLDLLLHIHAGRQLIGEEWSVNSFPVDVTLQLNGAPASALRLQRLTQEPLASRPKAVWREIFPSEGFMRRAHPEMPFTRRALVLAHAQRHLRITAGLPGAFWQWRRIKRLATLQKKFSSPRT